MSGHISEIKFCNYSLIISPSFLKGTEKMDKADVEIYSGEPSPLVSFTLAEESHRIDLSSQGEVSTYLNGIMYFDLSKEKIIFEGSYKIQEHSGTFWLEVNPNHYFFQNPENNEFLFPIAPSCEDYPMSVGTLSYDISSKATRNTRAEKPEVVVKLMENKPDSTGRVHLLTALNENMQAIRGIDTCIEIEKNGFIGDVGIIRNRVYIDGKMVEKGVVNCYFYIELSEDFLS
ncbi:MAG: hypothetical protein ACYDG2_19255 [Ruminiclostridium sp.]